ncbi:MAG TPA: hypothetical protein VGP70_22070 [Actinomadura sp.]|nr:hypothetical protein [Actinomadura sp.]
MAAAVSPCWSLIVMVPGLAFSGTANVIATQPVASVRRRLTSLRPAGSSAAISILSSGAKPHPHAVVTVPGGPAGSVSLMYGFDSLAPSSS